MLSPHKGAEQVRRIIQDANDLPTLEPAERSYVGWEEPDLALTGC